MPRKPATANRALMLMRKIGAVAVELAYRLDNPAAAIPPLKESPQPPRALSSDEQTLMSGPLAAAPPALRLIVELSLETGMRVGEILKLRYDDIDRQADVIRIRMSKAGVAQTTPITPAVARTLQAIESLRVDGNPYLFPARRGAGPMSPPYKALHQLLADAGVEKAGFHIFRKTAATVAASLPGSDVLTVSRMLRHQSVRTTEKHYIATDQQRLRQVAADLGEVMERRLKGGERLVGRSRKEDVMSG